MTNMKNYNEFCKSKKCPHYIKWNYGYADCYSCMLLGESYNIELYPENCIFLDDIKKVEIKRKPD